MGDAAVLIRDFEPWSAAQVAESIAALNLPGVVETSAAYRTVGVYGRPGSDLLRTVSERWPEIEAHLRDAPVREPVLHVIPTCYAMGKDLVGAAKELAMTPAELVDAHTSAVYDCAAIGFCPGFPYLGPLPSRIAGLPRRDTPRLTVPAGSVAIALDQTGIYPLERPGGWHLIGRTPLTIVDPDDDFFPITAGDQVRFVPVDETEYERLRGQRL